MKEAVFSFNVPEGSYQVNIHLPPDAGYSPGASVPITVASGDSKTVVIKVELNDAVIKGYLKDSSGKIITNVMAHVFVAGKEGMYKEGELNLDTGQYTINLSAGTWHLGYHIEPSTGYISGPPEREATVISAGQTIRKDIVLVKADHHFCIKARNWRACLVTSFNVIANPNHPGVALRGQLNFWVNSDSNITFSCHCICWH